jgi:hypothetical protein
VGAVRSGARNTAACGEQVPTGGEERARVEEKKVRRAEVLR